MTKVLIVPVLAAALAAAACGDDADPTGNPPVVDTRASVRFFNATTGMTGTGGFTTNGQFTTGSALAFGQATQNCSRLNAGSTTFGFGAANTGGTALNGSTLATLNSQTIADGGNFTLVAAGPASGPKMFLLDNTFPGTLASNQAAVRFVNLAPGTQTNPNLLAVFIGAFGGGGTLHKNNPTFGEPTTFTTVASGSNPFSLLNNHEVALTGTAATLNLEGGSVNTIAIVQTTSGSFQLINLRRC